jgi:hypothetical protein
MEEGIENHSPRRLTAAQSSVASQDSNEISRDTLGRLPRRQAASHLHGSDLLEWRPN